MRRNKTRVQPYTRIPLIQFANMNININFTYINIFQTGPNGDRFYTGCFSEKGCFGAPDGCVATKNCKIAVATIVKGESYEFELKAPQDAAWVAFGLSDDNKMGDDSVVECVRDQNGKFAAFMSRNLPNDKNVERLSRVSYNLIISISYSIRVIMFLAQRWNQFNRRKHG